MGSNGTFTFFTHIFRWDCEESNQIWQSCSDVPSTPTHSPRIFHFASVRMHGDARLPLPRSWAWQWVAPPKLFPTMRKSSEIRGSWCSPNFLVKEHARPARAYCMSWHMPASPRLTKSFFVCIFRSCAHPRPILIDHFCSSPLLANFSAFHLLQ